MKLTMHGTMGDKIKVCVPRNFHFNWRAKMYMENCNTEYAKYSKKGAKCYESSEKEKLLPGGNFREDSMKDGVVRLNLEE